MTKQEVKETTEQKLSPAAQGRIDGILKVFFRKFGYVYILECEGKFKIGMAKNVESRIRDIQISCPFKIKLIGKSSVVDMFKAERHLHQLFVDKKIMGEWFELSKEDILIAKKYLDGEIEKIDDAVQEFVDKPHVWMNKMPRIYRTTVR